MNTPLETTSRLSLNFQDYAQGHQTLGNQRCHFVGIPVIVIAIFGLLAQLEFSLPFVLPEQGVPLFRFDAGLVLWLLATVWYLTLDWRLGLPFSLVTLGFYWVGRALPVPGLWAAFFIGWAIQYLGHGKYEKNRPSFYRNLKHLLVGPLWIFAKAVGYTR